MTKELENKLREEVRNLLEKGKVDRVIGYGAGSLRFAATPLIISDKADVDRLIINPFIHNNLSVFLPDVSGKVAIVAKECDARSIISLVQNKQIPRENVYIIGVPCSGIIDLGKVEKLTGLDRDEIDDISWQGDKVTIASAGGAKEFTAQEVLADSCLGCDAGGFREFDLVIGEMKPVAADKELIRKRIKDMEAMSPAERWEFWKNEFSRCIRCYACRQICPVCFCDRCFVEETEPQWISPLPRWQDNLIFQAVRMMHVAGRCTDCGECERACPVNIPLGILTGKMEDIVEELFEYRAGMDKDAPPLMAAYQPEEAEDLIR
ncbi:MAG: 4Fe-4S dicluster domain-containing protein [Dehalococcoidia bacterium]|nr:4Fe-4S dicluster domain-containing protein [Dehalococcoidia bacterium]